MLGKYYKQYTKAEWETIDVMCEEIQKKRIVGYMVMSLSISLFLYLHNR